MHTLDSLINVQPNNNLEGFISKWTFVLAGKGVLFGIMFYWKNKLKFKPENIKFTITPMINCLIYLGLDEIILFLFLFYQDMLLKSGKGLLILSTYYFTQISDKRSFHLTLSIEVLVQTLCVCNYSLHDSVFINALTLKICSI